MSVIRTKRSQTFKKYLHKIEFCYYTIKHIILHIYSRLLFII